MNEDPRATTIRAWMSAAEDEPADVADMLRLNALEALTSLARDARKAALAEDVVEALADAADVLGVALGGDPRYLRRFPRVESGHAERVLGDCRRLLAAFRAEYPAESRDTTEAT